MFLGSTKPELEDGFLRSGRRFRSGKRRKTIGGRRIPSLFGVRECEFESRIDKGSCDEEEEYSPISEGAEESKESAKTPRSKCNYTTPRAFL